MEVSLTDTNNELAHEREKAEEEKCKLAEALEKAKIKHEQALANKNREISSEIERIKNTWTIKCAKKESGQEKQVNNIFNQ